jgi:hypothetical protein
MDKDRALRLALEALERSVATCLDPYSHEQVRSRSEHFINQAITAIKAALEAKDEPVVGTKTWFEDGKVVTQNLYYSDVYTTPPQRTWVEIDDEDFSKALELCDFDKIAAFEFFEAKLKEKNI